MPSNRAAGMGRSPAACSPGVSADCREAQEVLGLVQVSSNHFKHLAREVGPAGAPRRIRRHRRVSQSVVEARVHDECTTQGVPLPAAAGTVAVSTVACTHAGEAAHGGGTAASGAGTGVTAPTGCCAARTESCFSRHPEGAREGLTCPESSGV